MFRHGEEGGERARKFVHGEERAETSLPPDGTYIMKIVEVIECSRAKSGFYFHRLSMEVVFHPEFRGVTTIISCDEAGTPMGRFGWPRLKQIAEAVGIQQGDEYELAHLKWSPFRATVKQSGKFLDFLKFEKLTQKDREELAEYEARNQELGGGVAM